MATTASAARDIPQASLNRDNLAVVADRSEPATVARTLDLPTPPNSISPALAAHGLKAQLQKATLEPIDSDLDLHESADGRSVSPPLEASGAITCALLAKYHLPDILLNHGPLAIRHVMGYLTTSVPGFSGIPPAKARRLVVGALEGRGGEGGGPQGDIHFEKVGWGRWDACRRTSGPRSRKTSPSRLSPHSAGIPIGGASRHERLKVRSSGQESMRFSYDDSAVSVMENEADNMSLDGSGAASCSEAPDDDMILGDNPDDATDDEDWAAVGAAALRAESYRASFSSRGPFSPQFGARSCSYGMIRSPQTPIELLSLNGPSDAQEREAIEGLLRLGSV
ncbi:putative Sin3 binding protein-domain-containing protein [Emericellopsis atlantica]|uniref:Sin3 binding protein-domain-containing protein n=1 Tax=Emericellopsis atlantica TaxID=2614577 RepID=A0A9P7ZSH3_9HYPO|nr:putative Sin3 binding protein-domain-containing protein [Emericellopsis atlantica]KAG9257276.1 putative Sin3 binding protein-domain-containing protein [Emericellopsis atlantica]